MIFFRRKSFVVTVLLASNLTTAWLNSKSTRSLTRTSTRSSQQGVAPFSSSSLFSSSLGDETVDDDPCWEEIFDDDCAMSSVYASAFVAANWIKRMPCAAGIEVRVVGSVNAHLAHVAGRNFGAYPSPSPVFFFLLGLRYARGP